MQQQQAAPPLGGSIRLLVAFGVAYFLGVLYRTLNTVVGPEVAASLGLGVAEIGLITSAFFLPYALFQIPLGVLLDRYGPRNVEVVLLIVAACGAIVFGLGQSAATLAFGRALIGLGVSACLMAAMTANARWWPAERLALANGTILAVGGLGAIAATAPVEAALHYTDWRSLFVVLAAMTVIAAAVLFLLVPRLPGRPHAESWGSAFIGALRIFKEPVFLQVAPVTMLMQGSLHAYQGLWAAAWLRDVQGLDRVQTSVVLAFASSGIVFGTIGIGVIADRLARRGVSVWTVAMVGSAGYLLVQLAIALRLPLPDAVLWGAFVLFGMSNTLYFAILTRAFPVQLAGRAVTALNMTIFVGAFLLQWLVGVVVVALVERGVPTAAAHVRILAAVLAMQALGLAWLVWSRLRSRTG
ncbi:MAG TPA: MFS transporter [Xanthobacteraceae bacterium]